MKRAVLIAMGALALCAACGPMPHQKAAPAAEAACPDESPRLPGTGLCQRTAADLIQRAPGASEIAYPEGCTAAVNETMMIGDEALVYGAQRCGEAVTKLEFAAGAQTAEISLQGYEGVVIRLFGVDPDPQGALKAAIADLPEAARATCEIRPAGIEGWPADALVIAPTAAARAKLPKDEPVAACGPFGLDEDSRSYWRIRQGQAWFFDLGQDDPGFDAPSVTIIAKDASGAWAPRP